MTALVLVFCPQSAPTFCAEQRPIGELSPRACLMRGQQYALDWLAVHPKWVLSRWRCELNLPHEQPA
jgi:hypothetical protein